MSRSGPVPLEFETRDQLQTIWSASELRMTLRFDGKTNLNKFAASWNGGILGYSSSKIHHVGDDEGTIP